MSGLRLRPGDEDRVARLRRQGIDVPVDLEALTGTDDGGAGAAEVQRAEELEHAHDCGCADCAADRAAVGCDVGEHVAGSAYRAGVFCTKGAARFQSQRATSATPGESDDWVRVANAPARRSASSTTFKPPAWVLALTAEVRAWVHELVDPLVRRVASLETKGSGSAAPAELEARVAALEERLSGEARDWAAGSLADAFRGTFTDGQKYARGELTVFGGSLWLCLAATNGDERPGKTPSWRLVTKHGRDSREPR